MAQNCPTCGRSLAKTIRRAAIEMPERSDIDARHDRGEMTKDQYFAECKRIGLRDDVRFFIRVTDGSLPAALRAEADALLAELETRAARPAIDAKAINSLRDRYRIAKGSLTVRKPATLAGLAQANYVEVLTPRVA